MNKKIPWNSNENIHLENVDLCVKNIIIKNYLAHGAFGMVYSIKYDNKECVLKIIPIRNEDVSDEEDPKVDPLKSTTKFKNFKKEIDLLKKLNKKNLIPKLYNYGICHVDYYYKNASKKLLKVGYIISEKYDITMRDYIKEMIEDSVIKINRNKTKKHDVLTNCFKKILKIEKTINTDLISACEIGILNEDVHSSNIMIKYDKKKQIKRVKIVDWGLAYDGSCFEREDSFDDDDIPLIKKFIIRFRKRMSLPLDMANKILKECGYTDYIEEVDLEI